MGMKCDWVRECWGIYRGNGLVRNVGIKDSNAEGITQKKPQRIQNKEKVLNHEDSWSYTSQEWKEHKGTLN